LTGETTARRSWTAIGAELSARVLLWCAASCCFLWLSAGGAIAWEGSRWLETGNYYARDFGLKQALDIAEEFILFRANEGDCIPLVPCAPCTANAVDIVLWNVWEVVVDDMGEAVDIDPSGRDVCRNEDICPAMLEIR
jgi:hypothetical protein